MFKIFSAEVNIDADFIPNCCNTRAGFHRLNRSGGNFFLFSALVSSPAGRAPAVRQVPSGNDYAFDDQSPLLWLLEIRLEIRFVSRDPARGGRTDTKSS
ncbi:MAG TPA: hypothetical protein VF452_17935, partial [Candidatus Binatia bacterium]